VRVRVRGSIRVNVSVELGTQLQTTAYLCPMSYVYSEDYW
jgi:hypothetical protein